MYSVTRLYMFINIDVYLLIKKEIFEKKNIYINNSVFQKNIEKFVKKIFD